MGLDCAWKCTFVPWRDGVLSVQFTFILISIGFGETRKCLDSSDWVQIKIRPEQAVVRTLSNCLYILLIVHKMWQTSLFAVASCLPIVNNQNEFFCITVPAPCHHPKSVDFGNEILSLREGGSCLKERLKPNEYKSVLQNERNRNVVSSVSPGPFFLTKPRKEWVDLRRKDSVMFC